MATNYTTNYQLPLWEEDDAFLRTEFKKAFQKIDDTMHATQQQLDAAERVMGNCKWTSGSYTGTGTFGSAQPTQLIFDRQPLLLFIFGEYHCTMFGGAAWSTALWGSNSTGLLNVTWDGGKVSWYNPTNSSFQLNGKDMTYHYIAIFDSADG